MLRHLLERHAHPERVEPAAAVLLAGAQRPETSRLRHIGQSLVVVVGEVLGVGIHPLLGGDDLFLHEAADLLGEHPQFVGKGKAGEGRHRTAPRAEG